MSDKQRTDSDMRIHRGAYVDFLECELNAANERIKRLEDALDTLTLVVGLTPIAGNMAALQEAMDAARAALKSKEAKP